LTADDLVGTWTLTQIVPKTGNPNNANCFAPTCTLLAGTTDSADGLSKSRTDTVVISKSGSTYNLAQTNYGSFASGATNIPASGTIGVLADSVLFKTGNYTYFFDAKKKGSDQIILTSRIFNVAGSTIQIGNTSSTLTANGFSSSIDFNSSFNIIILDRKNTPPAPADAVSATVSGTSVALAWTDQSIDETGFKVQYKTSVKGSWTTASTTAANATSYTITGLTAGTYWIRVIATNTYGDAISSSEIQAVLQ
jgi:hypothetical protein